MIDIKDINYTPTVEEISDCINNPLFDNFIMKMEQKHKALPKIEFSKCSWEYGWNIKFKKSGKSLCTIYPRESFFTVLVVIGEKEKERAESFLANASLALREIYNRTKEGNGQRWLMIDLEDSDEVYNDVLKLIEIRRGVR